VTVFSRNYEIKVLNNKLLRDVSRTKISYFAFLMDLWLSGFASNAEEIAPKDIHSFLHHSSDAHDSDDHEIKGHDVIQNRWKNKD